MAQEKCCNFYGFETDSDIPKSNINWNMSQNNYHGGLRSLQSCGNGKSEYTLELTGPADVSFWWDSNKGNGGFYFYQRDNGEISNYAGTGWQRKTDSVPEGNHILKWTFSKKRSDMASGWIDDLCITMIPCEEKCPEDSSISKKEKKSNNDLEKLPPISENDSMKYDEDRTTNLPTSSNTSYQTIIESELFNGSLEKAPREVIVIPRKDNGYNTFSKIQTAINSVSPDGIVTVTNGNYYEKLTINKSIKLNGIDKNMTNIIGNNIHESIINITADGVMLSNLSINGGKFGVIVENSSGAIISNNIFKENGFGVLVLDSRNAACEINNNTFLQNTKEGIRIYSSTGVSVVSNKIIGPKRFGIFLYESYENKIFLNLIKSATNEGIYLRDSEENIIKNNTYDEPYSCDIYLEDSESIMNEIDQDCTKIPCGDSGQNCSCCI